MTKLDLLEYLRGWTYGREVLFKKLGFSQMTEAYADMRREIMELEAHLSQVSDMPQDTSSIRQEPQD